MKLRLLGWLFFMFLVDGLAVPAPVTAARTQIGGSGPYDRPTNHTGLWCYSKWGQDVCAAPVDSFVADGDTAVVRLTVRNTQFASFLLDDVVVVERSVYEAHILPVGGLADTEYICARFANPNPLMLDFASIAPQDLVYLTRFQSGIGPEWTVDASQVSWQTANTMYDDPFAPEQGSVTGHMAIGTGSGPSPLVVELTLDNVVAGHEYIVTYWSNSIPDEFPEENCLGPKDDWEVAIFGVDDSASGVPPYVGGARLDQNYPNPFNPKTNIQVELTRAGPVRLSVLDVRGRHVSTLFEGDLGVGIHDFPWNGRTDDGEVVAAAPYFYRLETGGEVLTRRMVLLK